MSADGYERRIGRYGRELADALIAATGVRPGQRALDVGCGPGALTERLVELLGSDQVGALDPDPDAVRRCAERLPEVDVRVGAAESLPYGDDEFDVVLGQLVVPFFTDPERGVREMRRVGRPGARIATCVWDFGEGMTVLRAFWDAAIATGAPGAEEHDQAKSRPYANPEDLRQDAARRSRARPTRPRRQPGRPVPPHRESLVRRRLRPVIRGP